MNIRSSAEIHFHQQEQVSVYFETNASGLEQELGEIALMTCFSIRILSILGVNHASDMLAQYLVNAPQAVEEFVSGSTGGFELINYPGYKGRRQFILNMVMNDSQFKLDLSQKGFGFLARGYGYYAPIGVFALLRFLASKPRSAQVLGHSGTGDTGVRLFAPTTEDHSGESPGSCNGCPCQHLLGQIFSSYVPRLTSISTCERTKQHSASAWWVGQFDRSTQPTSDRIEPCRGKNKSHGLSL